MRFLGRGSAKVVHVAHDERLGRDVALSQLAGAAGGEEARARAHLEMRIMARLGDHPHIVTIYDAAEDEAGPYFVARLMRGGSLAERLAAAGERRLDVAEAVRIAAEVAEGLAHAHAAGIVHRDVKPDNIWLDEHGRAALGDFGVAHSAGGRLTAHGAPVGTPLYMSPEQIRGEPDVDARADLYGLGATLYELLCGRPPFAGDAGAVSLSHLVTPPAPPWERRPEVPRPLGDVVLGLLAKDRADRPSSAAEARERLLAAAAGGDEAPFDGREPVVGRERELRTGRAALQRALAGTGRLLALHGEPGIGKTTLVRELAREAGARGAAVLWSSCEEEDGSPPYWPWGQMLRELPAATGCALPPELERLVAGDSPATPAASPKDARFRMYATVSAVLRTAAAARPLVLVIDDLQWADEGSVALLARVADDLERMRVLVLATYRDRRLADPLEAAIARLARNPHAELVPLSGLERDDVGELLERTADVRSPGLAAALAEHTLGNPFFVGEVVRMLVAEGRMEGAGRHPRRALESVPSTVRHVVGHRLGAVSPGAREVLEAAAVQSTDFETDVVARALGRPAIDVGEALEAAAAAHLVREDPAGGGAWSFAHGIVRQAVYERVSRTRRGRLHAAVAAALEERRAGAADDVGDLAHHYGVAAAIGLDTHAPAVRYSRQAAERAIGLLAYDVAVEHLERAERLLGTMGDGAVAEHCDVLLALAQARAAAGDLPQAKRDSVTAARLSRAAGDAPRLARAARRRAEWATYGIVDHEAVALLGDALARLPEADGEDRAHLLALLAARLDPAEAQPQRERLIAEALAIARRRGDRDALPLLLLRSAYINFGCDRAAFRAAATDEAIAIGGDDDEYAMRAHVLRFADALAAGATTLADAELERYTAIARRLKLPYYDWYGLILRATREAFRGDAAAAERLAEAARASIGAQEDDSDQEWVVQRLMLARLRGRLADARAEPLRANAERYPDLLMWRAMASWLDAETGRPDRAAGAVSDELLARLDRVQRDEDRLTVLFFLGDTVATLGDRYAAQRLLPLLAAEAARNVVTDRGWAAWGPAARVAGRLAAVCGDFDAAARHFGHAIELTRGWGARGWLVHAIVDYARAVPAPVPAAGLLAEAEALSARYGLRPVQERLAGYQ